MPGPEAPAQGQRDKKSASSAAARPAHLARAAANRLWALQRALFDKAEVSAAPPELAATRAVLSQKNIEKMTADHVIAALEGSLRSAVGAEHIPEDVRAKLAEAAKLVRAHMSPSLSDLPDELVNKILLSLPNTELYAMGGLNQSLRALTKSVWEDRAERMSYVQRPFLPPAVRQGEKMQLIEISEALPHYASQMETCARSDPPKCVGIYLQNVESKLRYLSEERLERLPEHLRGPLKAAIMSAIGCVSYASYHGYDANSLRGQVSRTLLYDCPPFVRAFLSNPDNWEGCKFLSCNEATASRLKRPFLADFPTWLPVEEKQVLQLMPKWLARVEADTDGRRPYHSLSFFDLKTARSVLRTLTDGHFSVIDRHHIWFLFSAKHFDKWDVQSLAKDFPKATVRLVGR